MKIFIENGIAYFGIPEDMLIYFLDQALKGKESEKFEKGKEMLSKLGLVMAAQQELDDTMARTIEATMLEQIVESERLLTDRAQWVTHTVRFDKSMNLYRYSTDNLADLNAKMQLKYRLNWIYKILNVKYAGIALASMEDRSTGKKREIACIDIPKTLIDKIRDKTTLKQEPPQLEPTLKLKHAVPDPDPVPVVVSGPKPTIDEMLAKLKQPTWLEKQQQAKIDQYTSQEEQEIAELMIAFVQRDNAVDSPFLKARVEREISKTIEWDKFNKIRDYLIQMNMIIMEGTVIKKNEKVEAG